MLYRPPGWLRRGPAGAIWARLRMSRIDGSGASLSPTESLLAGYLAFCHAV